MFIITIKKFPFDKKYKCKGNSIIPNTNIMELVLENEERILIPLNKYILHFDNNWFREKLSQIEKESQGKAKVNHGLEI